MSVQGAGVLLLILLQGCTVASDGPVLSQYTDLPYPPYTRREEVQEKQHYVDHTLCQGGECHLVARPNTSQLHGMVPALETEVLNSLLYQVWQSAGTIPSSQIFTGTAEL